MESQGILKRAESYLKTRSVYISKPSEYIFLRWWKLIINKIFIEDLWNAYEILFWVQALRGRLVGNAD